MGYLSTLDSDTLDLANFTPRIALSIFSIILSDVECIEHLSNYILNSSVWVGKSREILF